jgi:two-component system, NtrC family, nitrogen regulation response regulator GlnG
MLMPAGSILVADDDAAIRTVLNQALSRAGYEVRSTSNAATLWRWISQGDGDLVITDVVMPEMGGRELGRRLKVMRPSLPVLFMSGYTGEDVIQRGLMDADAPFQQKPFAPDGLARKVRVMLDDARARLQSA